MPRNSRNADRLANALEVNLGCPQDYYSEKMLRDGKMPAWCIGEYDADGDPISCRKSNVADCRLKLARGG